MLTPGWLNSTTDDIDWTSDVNGTSSLDTGPQDNQDYNPGTTSGHYLYTEASGSLTGGIEMSFAYNMYGLDMGTLGVDYRVGSTGAWTTLIAPYTDNFDGWQIKTADLTFLNGTDSVQFRFAGTTGAGYESDMCLDDINIYETFFEGAITNINNETCFEASNGSMTAVYSYGVEPVSISWSTGDTTATITGLAPGTYCVTMIDANDDTVTVCDSIVALASAPLLSYTHAIDKWVCTDSMGYLVIDSITGGVPTAIDCGISPLGCTGPTDTVQIDTNQVLIGQYSYPSPLGNWYHGTRHQMIYRASELTAAGIVPGNLSGLAFYIDNMAGATPNLTGMRIKIGCTPDSVAVVFNDTATVEVFPPILKGFFWE